MSQALHDSLVAGRRRFQHRSPGPEIIQKAMHANQLRILANIEIRNIVIPSATF
jgi:hypothetical protein